MAELPKHTADALDFALRNEENVSVIQLIMLLCLLLAQLMD
jgi:hypothetical protein